MAHIEKRGLRKYRARYIAPDGKERNKTFTTEREAKKFLASVENAKNTGAYVDPARSRQSFHSFATEWAGAQDWTQTTREGFPYHLARLNAVLPSNVQLGTIDQLTIKRARTDLAKKYAPSTVDVTMSYLVGIMSAAYVSGRIPRDPTRGVVGRARRSRNDQVGPDNVPTRQEVAMIWSAAPPAYRAAVALGASGLRVGEVLGLTSDRIDLDGRLVVVDRQLQRVNEEMIFTPPKGGREFGDKARTIRVSGAVALELRRHLREQASTELLFLTPRTGNRMRRDQFYASGWRPALLGAGLAKDRYDFHSLRHFCASSMLAEGVNPMAVAGYIGDTLETLQRTYAHWLRDDRDVPADALDRILDNSRPDDGMAFDATAYEG
jgi:integrase